MFAGNIDLRLDYDLISSLAIRHPEMGFVLAGPVNFASLSVQQRQDCDALLGLSNVRALGLLPPEDLPALYWTCDVGILPYRTDLPMLVENGFPLKALEMAAAGLPVVSSLMKPLQEVSEAVTLVASQEAFSCAIVNHSRRTRPEAARLAAELVCRAYDYDIIFERMLGELGRGIQEATPKPGDLADFVARIGVRSFRRGLAGLCPMPRTRSLAPLTLIPNVLAAKASTPFRYRAGELLGFIPQPVRRMVPASMRRLGRRWMT